MFIITARVKKSKVLIGLTTLVLVAGLTAAGTGLVHRIQDTEAISSTLVSTRGIRTNQDRIAFLQSYGWTVGEDPLSVEEVRIPEVFDPSYDSYLAIQREQGFSLEEYAGKTAKRYTYAITNYPGLSENVWASLLITKKTVIAGEVYTSQGDGFMHGLAFPLAEDSSDP